MVAPVCPGQPTAPASAFGTSGPKFPAIPYARDLQSALAAINALREAVMLLSQQLQSQQQPPARPQTGKGQGGSGGKTQPSRSRDNWKETKRIVKKERVENPDDPAQFVEVDVITELTMTNQANRETWTWRR